MGIRAFGLPIHLLPSQVGVPLNPLDQIAFLQPGALTARIEEALVVRQGSPLTKVGVRKLATVLATTGSLKESQLECRSAGGEMVLGRCISLPPGGTKVGLRALEIATPGFLGANPGFFPQGGAGAGQAPLATPSILQGLIQGGFGALNTFIASKFGSTGVASPSPNPLIDTRRGGLIPTAGPGGLTTAAGAPQLGIAVVSGAIVAAGGTIVGTVIRISRAGWARVPALIKQAAVFLGLTVALTDVDLFGGGGGMAGELSQAQQNKIARFQQMTGAGVPPGIAARATGIGRKRRRGISAFELSGFRKISHMLSHWGMVPRGLTRARARRHHHHK